MMTPDGTISPVADAADEAERALMELPEEFWSTRELRHIKQAADANYANPLAVLGAFLACLAAEVHPRVRTPIVAGTPGSMNLIVVAAGQSGTGKTLAVEIAQDLVGSMRALVREPSSGEGLIATYRSLERDERDGVPPGMKTEVWITRGVLAFTDEVSTLSGVGSRQGNTLMSRLRSLISGSHIGTANATQDRNRTLPGRGYSFGYVIGAQPGNADVLLGSEAVTTGLAGRLLAVPVRLGEPVDGIDDPGRIRIQWPDGVRLDPDKDRDERHLDRPPDSIVMSADPVVAREVRPAIITARQGKGSPDQGHQAYVRVKVASLLAILHGRLEVTVEDWEKSGQIVAVSRETLAWMARHERDRLARGAEARGVSDARREEAREDAKIQLAAVRIYNIAAGHAGDPRRCRGREHHAGCTRACLTSGVSSVSRVYVDEGLELAITNGWIDTEASASASSRDEAAVTIYLPGPEHP